jgi:hypothetical protein
LCVLSFVLKMSTPKRKRNLFDFRQKREIVEIKNTTNNETWEAAHRKLLQSIHIYTFLSFLRMHSQSNNSQHVHVDYNPLKGRLVLISSLMFRKSRSLEDIKQAVKANRYRCENS